MKLQFGTFAGKTYRLEYTEDLMTGQWHILADRIPGTGNPIIVLAPEGVARPQRFYRAGSGPAISGLAITFIKTQALSLDQCRDGLAAMGRSVGAGEGEGASAGDDHRRDWVHAH